MIIKEYKLVSPRTFSVEHKELETITNKVIVRPEYMAICHADQRYYMGTRDAKILRQKLPMDLIHECCGEVVMDPTGTYKQGQKVLLIPNIPTEFENDYYENYSKNSKFMSSSEDGFMREYLSMPVDRIVPYSDINPVVAAITEFFSVAVHAVDRFKKLSASRRETVGIWGDGNLGYMTAVALKYLCPNIKICVIGLSIEKLLNFTFVHETYLATDLPTDFKVDHAFECVGSSGCEPAYRQIIDYIEPQGAMMLMGVSETPVPLNTRMVLEKGITCVGCSRSGRIDFEKAVEILKDKKIQKRINTIIASDYVVRNLEEAHKVFKEDYSSTFKTVFKWEI